MDLYSQATKQLNFESYEDEVINFEYYGNSIPSFENNINQTQNDEQIDIKTVPDDYLDKYQKKDEDSYILYKVSFDDSIYGLELKFEVSALAIMRINNISENSLYPDMIIKIPNKQQLQQLSNTQQLDQNQLYQYNEPKYIVDIKYITKIGTIFGKLILYKSYFHFQPEIQNLQNNELISQAKIKNLENISFVILIKHIESITLKDLPFDIEIQKNQIVNQHLIVITTQTKIQKYLLFNVINENELHILLQIANFEIHNYKTESTILIDQKTIIPYYYDNLSFIETIIYDIVDKQENELQNKKQFEINQINEQKQIDNNSQLNNISQIITESYLQSISQYLPFLFKGQKWEIVYSNIKHGSSINTVMRKCQNQIPLILIIKDIDSYIFGSYLSEGIKQSKGSFYGNGESLLFTFKNTNKIQVYKWTTINNYFTICDQDGLGIGCGDKYGLYINNEISQDYSYYCDTYNNEILSKQSNYVIDRLEIWGISQN